MNNVQTQPGVGAGALFGGGAPNAQMQQPGMQQPGMQQGMQQQAAPAGDDPMAALSKAKQLLDAGLITQEEYDAKKAEVLGNL